MSEQRWRHTAAIYLALFFFAVAAAPHHHLNGIDQPSSSGYVTQVLDPAPAHGTWGLHSICVVADEWCMACFTSDFVSVPPAPLSFVTRPVPLTLRAPATAGAIPKLVPADPSSRAPPRVS